MNSELEKWLDHAGPGRDMVTAAAVRERFAPTAMLRSWVDANPLAEQAEVLEAMEVAVDLQAVGIPALAADGSAALALPQQVRLAILRGAEVDAVQGQLRRDTAQTLTESTFRALLDGTPVAIESSSREQLTALGEAVQWAQSLGVARNVDDAQIKAELQRRDFLETLGGGDLERFVGREQFLDTLRLQWNLRPDRREVVLVEAPGGMGKSLTVARFVADLLAADDVNERPDAVFLLDFERLDLQRGRLSTLVSEIFRQSARWWVSEGSESLVSQAAETQTFGLDSVGWSSRGVEAIFEPVHEAWRVVDPFRTAANRQPRFIVFADTFEEVETFSDDAARSVGEICEMMRAAGADVMEIYASRHFAKPRVLGIRREPKLLKLVRLKQGEALTFLRQEAARLGIALDKRTADAALRRLDGWPLDLRFAVALMGREPAQFDPERWLAELESSPERRQATLYDRVLKRIRDDDVRSLAKPGLLLRRLTAPIIAEVLAVPCGLTLDQTQAEDLLARAGQLGQLFVTDPSDPGAVWHKRDVRSLMFADLRIEIAPEVATAIHRGAVEFYARGERPGDRAEELYHHMQLGEPDKLLNERWQPEAVQMLKRSLNELPAAGAAWLRDKLGAASLSGAVGKPVRAGRNDARTVELRMVARGRLQVGEAGIDDILEAAGAPHSVMSPFGDIYAESLIHRGRADEAIAGAQVLRSSRAPIAREVRAGVYACAAAALEGQHRWREAFNFWSAAQHSSERLPPVERLGPRIGALRSGRRIKGFAKRAWRLTKAAYLTLQIGHVLAEHRVAAREAAAELGELIQPRSSNPVSVMLVDLIGELLRSDDIFMQAKADPARREEIGKRLVNAGPIMDQRQLNDMVAKLLYGGDPRFVRDLVSIMREEVDWTLVRAAKKDRT